MALEAAAAAVGGYMRQESLLLTQLFAFLKIDLDLAFLISQKIKKYFNL